MEPSGRIILAGGSGFLGQAMIPDLQKRFQEIVVLTRGREHADGSVRYVSWDAASTGEWCQWLDGATAVINLVGRSVDCRKTPQNRKLILESRVNSVQALAAGCK